MSYHFNNTTQQYNRMDDRYREVHLCNELLGWKDFTVDSFPRFREAVVEEKEPWIAVRTRTGGGNREEYADEIRHCQSLLNFHHSEDDSFDNTYMYFWYKVPRESMDKWREFVGKTKEEFPDSDSY